MTTLLAIALFVLGILALSLPVRGVRLKQVRLGSRVVALSSPIDFKTPAVAVATALFGAACLVGALFLSGLMDGMAGTGGDEASGPQTTGNEIGLIEVDEAEGLVVIRTLLPDSMAAWTALPDAGDVHVEVDAEVIHGPEDGVSCIALRGSGDEQLPGQSFRVTGSSDWPRGGYMFCVAHTGEFVVAEYTDGQPELLHPFQPSTTIKSTEANRLGARAEGGQLAFTINNVTVAELSDDTYARGMVQLVCGTPAEEAVTTTCHFRNLDVTALD